MPPDMFDDSVVTAGSYAASILLICGLLAYIAYLYRATPDKALQIMASAATILAVVSSFLLPIIG